MASLSAIIAWIMANPQFVALGESAISAVVKLATDAWNLHASGVLTDQQLADVWAAVGVDVKNADAAWDAALAAHVAASKPAA
jgi:hypothetical protein